ncbi:uncharacterized protein LOC131244130 [Magnolia sinica]|uniref:uncharacterized protein LOC131244130 n=1 Tax=Magnolia sinica TaxID=86752 RepID=UPI002658FCDD|nr:uncharacterized protein LOC131244130 [Magnolia sinica]
MPPRQDSHGCGSHSDSVTRVHLVPPIVDPSPDPIPEVLVPPPVDPIPPPEPIVPVPEVPAPAVPVPPPEASVAPPMTTIRDFVNHFDQKFFPEHIQEQRTLEFETLVQSDMTMVQYEARFVALSSFATYLVDDERRKGRRFVSGLRPALGSRVVGHLLTTFTEVVHRALVYKEDWATSRRSREQSGDRKMKAPSGSSHQHQRRWHRGRTGFRRPAAQPMTSSS